MTEGAGDPAAGAAGGSHRPAARGDNPALAPETVRALTKATYEAEAAAWDAARSRTLFERPWLDRFLAAAPEGAPVLDLGCGAGEPVAAYLLSRGRRVTGVDVAAPMLAIARSRLPGARWIEADMRTLDLGERFGGIVGWDSFFHLSAGEQRRTIPRLARHLLPAGALLLTVGPREGEAIGRVGRGSPVYHASLSPAEYRSRLAEVGLDVLDFRPEDPGCAGHSVLLAAARR